MDMRIHILSISHEFLRLIKEWHVAISGTSEGLSLDGWLD